jgi:hypothetical protein
MAAMAISAALVCDASWRSSLPPSDVTRPRSRETARATFPRSPPPIRYAGSSGGAMRSG